MINIVLFLLAVLLLALCLLLGVLLFIILKKVKNFESKKTPKNERAKALLRYENILKNIAVYDGTERGQKDID